MKLSSNEYLIWIPNPKWELPQPGTPDHIKQLIRNHYDTR